jgi:hypothetical protein
VFGLIAARLAPDAVGETFVKIKTLQLIIATLQCPPELRSETSKFRLCIMDQALGSIKVLTTYTCEPDPKHGDKPAANVVRTTPGMQASAYYQPELACTAGRPAQSKAHRSDLQLTNVRVRLQRKGASRAEEILTANKKAVSNSGAVHIPARKSKDTTLEMKPGGKIAWVTVI